jgi:ATP phosphoribosyltransferase
VGLINHQVKIALPKGRLLGETAALLQRAGWGLDGYHEKARFYRPKSVRFPNLLAKVFHEKDIPVQVAVGNYDLGICGLDWVEELLVKYPSSALVKVRNLGYGEGALYIAASRSEKATTIEDIQARTDIIRIAGEYPNLAESFALKNRLRRFSIFPLWGAAEVYPPESADLALIPLRNGSFNHDLVPISRVLDFSAFLIANKTSWGGKDLNNILASICNEVLPGEEQHPAPLRAMPGIAEQHLSEAIEDVVWLALPDGHQQLPALRLLNKAGIQIDDYPSAGGNRRPTTNLAGVMIKVIRPQDMPLQVANGNFALAITGRDWLREHLYQFPTSPVKELLDLKFGRVKIVAVVSRDLSIDDVYSLRKQGAEHSAPFRVASEYVNIADKYARDNHLGLYRVIPTWGASEAFLPEDADLLIENTQTGRTLAQHNLKVVDTLFESTACLIGNSNITLTSIKGKRIKSIIETLQAVAEDNLN